MIVIAFGTGGIKPCVSAFGGDQFTSKNVHLLPVFFSIFYFSINAGSLISTLLTPVLRGLICIFIIVYDINVNFIRLCILFW